MPQEPKVYIVGRRNSRVRCDIELPETEKSVSRKHLELTVDGSERCYLVHISKENTTKVLDNGTWRVISQESVEIDAPLLLGSYRTTAREMLARMGSPVPNAPEPADGRGGKPEWDPERGTFLRPR